MSHILVITSHPNPEKSQSVALRDQFLFSYQEAHPDDQVTHIHLEEAGVGCHDAQSYAELLEGKGGSRELADQFAAADKYVFVAPFWNFSFPARLKAYIDHIVMAGVSFKFTDEGPVGLLEGKKALFITARGGIYSTPEMAPYEMGCSFMEKTMEFLGVTNFESIIYEGVFREGADDRLSAAQEKARALGESW